MLFKLLLYTLVLYFKPYFYSQKTIYSILYGCLSSIREKPQNEENSLKKINNVNINLVYRVQTVL